ncbi:MAG: hypothetical protein FJZ90_19715 [Chloroflexi bacterium]|nr:hypothetical protein [Chloroflexota bacterium]
MVRRMSRAQRREAFLHQAMGVFEELDRWYEEHPEATFAELEQQARKQRREFMGKVLEIVINGHRTGAEEAAPRCPQCGAEMKLRDYRPKTVRGLEGDSVLERAYYVCPQKCGETLFPPGSPAASAAGSVE